MLRLLSSAMALALLGAGVPQAASAQGSPLADLLASARASLNDLNSPRADSLAQMALRVYVDALTPEQRIEALMISAAARYPEPYEGSEQYPDSAMRALRQIVRLSAEYRPRPDITWSGLDSLLAEARASTFAPRLREVGSVELRPDSAVTLADGVSSLRARWSWVLRAASDSSAADSGSTGPATDAAIAVVLRLDGERVSIPTGLYHLEVSAEDERNAEVLTWRLPVEVEAQPLVFRALPPPLEAAELLREFAPPARAKGIAVGLLAAGVTVLGSSVLRQSSDVGAAVSADGRAVAVGAAIAIGAGIAGYLDRGTDLPANRAANARRQQAREQALRRAVAENEALVMAYRASARVTGVTR